VGRTDDVFTGTMTGQWPVLLNMFNRARGC